MPRYKIEATRDDYRVVTVEVDALNESAALLKAHAMEGDLDFTVALFGDSPKISYCVLDAFDVKTEPEPGISCPDCANYEEMHIDRPRHHTQNFRMVRAFCAEIGHTDPDTLAGRAVYECLSCGSMAITNFYTEDETHGD